MPLNNPWIRNAAWCGWVALVIWAAWALFATGMTDGLILGCFALAAAAFMAARRRLPALFSLLFVVAALINAAGWAFDLWAKVPGYDPFAHAYTTFAFTLALGFVTYYSVRSYFVRHRTLFVITLTSFGMALGGVWEMIEWVIGSEQTYTGIVQDLLMDTLGALVAAVLATWTIRREPDRRIDGAQNSSPHVSRVPHQQAGR